MKVIKATYLKDYSILIEFSDGTASEADFRGFIFARNQNPMTSQFKDQNLFAKVFVEHGTLSWFGEMDFDPSDLYYNRIPGITIQQIHNA